MYNNIDIIRLTDISHPGIKFNFGMLKKEESFSIIKFNSESFLHYDVLTDCLEILKKYNNMIISGETLSDLYYNILINLFHINYTIDQFLKTVDGFSEINMRMFRNDYSKKNRTYNS